MLLVLYVKEDSKDVSFLVSAFLDFVYHFGDHCVCRESFDFCVVFSRVSSLL